MKSEVDARLKWIGIGELGYEINMVEFNAMLKTLRNNKALGFSEISNEMIKYGGEKRLAVLLKIIFEKIIQHGKIPHFFNIGRIIPIIKDEKSSASDINNTRPITISDSLANIFEKKTHKEHKLQFGFKKNSSCNHAVFVLKETANYYNHTSKSIYACVIDASKAFDKINRLALMHKLMIMTSAVFWRALYAYYEALIAYVSNKNETSAIFKTSIGVKQGGPLSPRLFSIYVEALIEELLATELGTKLCGIKTGVIMYADDLIVVSEEVEKLQSMLSIIETYCGKWEIKLNAKKKHNALDLDRN